MYGVDRLDYRIDLTWTNRTLMDRLEERNHSRKVAVKGCSIDLASQPHKIPTNGPFAVESTWLLIGLEI